jgi:L-asparagine oxygenase
MNGEAHLATRLDAHIRDILGAVRSDARPALTSNGFYRLSCGVVLDDDALIAVTRLVGSPFGEPRDPRLVRPTSPISAAHAPSNTLSSRYGFGAFPFHTDTAYLREPADILLLHCADPGASRRATALVDTRAWSLSPREAHVLRNEVWVVRSARPPFHCTVGTGRHELSVRCNFDCMGPAVRTRHESRAIIDEHLARAEKLLITWSTGDLLVLDNRRVLHARAPAVQEDSDRELKRVLVRAGGQA